LKLRNKYNLEQSNNISDEQFLFEEGIRTQPGFRDTGGFTPSQQIWPEPNTCLPNEALMPRLLMPPLSLAYTLGDMSGSRENLVIPMSETPVSLHSHQPYQASFAKFGFKTVMLKKKKQSNPHSITLLGLAFTCSQQPLQPSPFDVGFARPFTCLPFRRTVQAYFLRRRSAGSG
jgi:hypothetical protein